MKKTALALTIMFALLVSLVVGVPFAIMFAQAQISSPEPAVLDHFDFSPISSPQAVGVPFNITITTKDQYNQTLTSYNGPNKLSTTLIITNTRYSDDLGVTGAFVNGVWSGEITLSKGGGMTYIYTSGGGKDKASNYFFVEGPPLPSVLDHFSFDYISDGQTVGIPFKITITAMDQYNQTFMSYNGTNTLGATEIDFHIVDLSKMYHVSLGVTGAFINGVWSGQVTIPEALYKKSAGYIWEISTSGGGKSGKSNVFIVHNPPPTSLPTLTPFPSPSPSLSPTSTLTLAPTLTPSPEPTPKVEPFSTTLIVASVVLVAVIGIGLLVYFKKRQKGSVDDG
jgi:hypothetical protein